MISIPPGQRKYIHSHASVRTPDLTLVWVGVGTVAAIAVMAIHHGARHTVEHEQKQQGARNRRLRSPSRDRRDARWP